MFLQNQIYIGQCVFQVSFASQPRLPWQLKWMANWYRYVGFYILEMVWMNHAISAVLFCNYCWSYSFTKFHFVGTQALLKNSSQETVICKLLQITIFILREISVFNTKSSGRYMKTKMNMLCLKLRSRGRSWGPSSEVIQNGADKRRRSHTM